MNVNLLEIRITRHASVNLLEIRITRHVSVNLIENSTRIGHNRLPYSQLLERLKFGMVLELALIHSLAHKLHKYRWNVNVNLWT